MRTKEELIEAFETFYYMHIETYDPEKINWWAFEKFISPVFDGDGKLWEMYLGQTIEYAFLDYATRHDPADINYYFMLEDLDLKDTIIENLI